MLDRSVNTLFMLMSVDGKISTGGNDGMDMDRDLPQIPGVGLGLRQYYDYESRTDLHSLNTGRVMAKIGVNGDFRRAKIPASFIILDNSHLTAGGVRNLAQWVETLYLITGNKSHPAYESDANNLKIIDYDTRAGFAPLFARLKSLFGIQAVTVQTGATVNAELMRQGLIDYLSIFVAPCVIGGRDTACLIGGESLASPGGTGENPDAGTDGGQPAGRLVPAPQIQGVERGWLAGRGGLVLFYEPADGGVERLAREGKAAQQLGGRHEHIAVNRLQDIDADNRFRLHAHAAARELQVARV